MGSGKRWPPPRGNPRWLGTPRFSSTQSGSGVGSLARGRVWMWSFFCVCLRDGRAGHTPSPGSEGQGGTLNRDGLK